MTGYHGNTAAQKSKAGKIPRRHQREITDPLGRFVTYLIPPSTDLECSPQSKVLVESFLVLKKNIGLCDHDHHHVLFAVEILEH